MIPDAEQRVVLLDGVGFGYANVVVAVPQAWIDVRGMADLDDVATAFRARNDRKMRVATKYVNLTRGFFAAHGIVDYRIVESLGATEGAPAAGSAELIVDITTTGATLAANGLKVIEDGIILRSQANLVASRQADWGAQARETARIILDRIAAQARAGEFREVRTRFPDSDDAFLAEVKERFGASAPFGGPTSSGMLTLHAPTTRCMRSRISCARKAPTAFRSDARLCVRARQSALRQAGSGAVTAVMPRQRVRALARPDDRLRRGIQ